MTYVINFRVRSSDAWGAVGRYDPFIGPLMCPVAVVSVWPIMCQTDLLADEYQIITFVCKLLRICAAFHRPSPQISPS
jgi:hypothetical protein